MMHTYEQFHHFRVQEYSTFECHAGKSMEMMLWRVVDEILYYWDFEESEIIKLSVQTKRIYLATAQDSLNTARFLSPANNKGMQIESIFFRKMNLL